MKRPRIVKDSGPYWVTVSGARVVVNPSTNYAKPRDLAVALERWLNAPYGEKE